MLSAIPSDPALWGPYRDCIVVQVESLTLSPDALRDPRVSYVMVSHMLLEDMTKASDQTTRPAARAEGPIACDYAVAYHLTDR